VNRRELAERLLHTMKKSGIQFRVMNGIVQWGPQGALRAMEVAMLEEFTEELRELILSQRIDLKRNAS
jgi:hypothetical protein